MVNILLSKVFDQWPKVEVEDLIKWLYFLPILLDKKKERDRYSKNRKVKIEVTFSKNVFLIVILHWFILHLFKTSINICKKNHVKKSGRYNPSLNTANKNKIIDNLDKRANNLNISIIDKNINKIENNLNRSRDTADTN